MLQDRPCSTHNAANAATACEEIIDLAAESSDDDEPAPAHAPEQPRQQQAKRRGVLQLPPAPAYMAGRPQSPHRSAAFTSAGPGRQGAARKPGDRSYLGAYSAADIAEGRFRATGSWPAAAEQPATDAAEPAAAAASEEPRYHDQRKGKQPMAEADDYEDGFGGDDYDADVAEPSSRCADGGGGYDGDAQQEEWEEWQYPGEEAGPSYASPQQWWDSASESV